MGDLWLAALHLVARTGRLSRAPISLAHDELFHLLLELDVDGFLVEDLLLVHVYFASLNLELLADRVGALPPDLSHLAVFE